MKACRAPPRRRRTRAIRRPRQLASQGAAAVAVAQGQARAASSRAARIGSISGFSMSPFLYANNLSGALLMYHDLGDQNVGTDPTNSMRLFHALNGLGKTTALYLYPLEDHGPATKETLLDLWARWAAWLDKYVKTRRRETRSRDEGHRGEPPPPRLRRPGRRGEHLFRSPGASAPGSPKAQPPLHYFWAVI